MNRLSTLLLCIVFSLVHCTIDAFNLSPGDILIVEGTGRVVHIDPATGARTDAFVGSLLRTAAGIAFAPNGDILVADADAFGGKGGLIRIVPSSGAMTSVSSKGNFVQPWGVAVGNNGEFYVNERFGFQYPPSGGSVNAVGAVIEVDPTLPDDGIGTNQRVVSSGGFFFDGFSIDVDTDGTILVPSRRGHLFRVNPTIPDDGAGSGNQTVISSGGLFSQPLSVRVAPNGDYYVLDLTAAALFRVDSATGAQSLVSSGGFFNFPFGMEVAPNGDILIADPGSHTLFSVDPVTGAQTLISSGGTGPYAVAIVPTLDSDNDGMRDAFEQLIIDADPGDAITTLADVLPDDDFDGDGLTNLVEHFLGLDPLVNNNDGVFEGLEDGSLLRLRYRRSKVVPAAFGQVEWSINLLDWFDTGITEVIVEDLGVVEIIEATVPINTEDKLFLRLVIKSSL